jgi:hypothetical protein
MFPLSKKKKVILLLSFPPLKGPLPYFLPFLLASFLSSNERETGRERERTMRDYNVPIAPRVSVRTRRKEGPNLSRRPRRAEWFRLPQLKKGHALTPCSFTRLSSSPLQIHQAYMNESFAYTCQGMGGNVAQQQVLSQPMRDTGAFFHGSTAAAAPPPPPPPHNHHHHHASPKRWPSSQTAAVDAVAAAWAAATSRDRSGSRASSGGGGFISAQHSSSPTPPQQQQPQHLSRDSSSLSSFADPLAAFQQQQQLMKRPPRRREG